MLPAPKDKHGASESSLLPRSRLPADPRWSCHPQRALRVWRTCSGLVVMLPHREHLGLGHWWAPSAWLGDRGSLLRVGRWGPCTQAMMRDSQSRSTGPLTSGQHFCHRGEHTAVLQVSCSWPITLETNTKTHGLWATVLGLPITKCRPQHTCSLSARPRPPAGRQAWVACGALRSSLAANGRGPQGMGRAQGCKHQLTPNTWRSHRGTCRNGEPGACL